MASMTSQPRPHALAQALPRSAGFALLRPASKPALDATRIVTMSGTMAINLIALGLLMMPLAMPPPAVWQAPKPTTTIRQIPVEPIFVKIVPATDPTPTVAPTQPTVREAVAPPKSQSTNTVIQIDTGNEFVESSTAGEDTSPVTESISTAVAAPTAVQLEYLSAPPPKYPRSALQRRIEGTVLLQVLVGMDGRPLDVTVSQSSGNRDLDEAAREQILKRWSFRPAMKNGQGVQAIGLVPVAFSLRR